MEEPYTIIIIILDLLKRYPEARSELNGFLSLDCSFSFCSIYNSISLSSFFHYFSRTCFFSRDLAHWVGISTVHLNNGLLQMLKHNKIKYNTKYTIRQCNCCDVVDYNDRWFNAFSCRMQCTPAPANSLQ